ncbi:MAG TPA: hypothetical protein VKU00_29420, partial [Chthonomonadaceae bacterium]|nr:hypothetical protein [Chthonomonadaceae bacterium]
MISIWTVILVAFATFTILPPKEQTQTVSDSAFEAALETGAPLCAAEEAHLSHAPQETDMIRRCKQYFAEAKSASEEDGGKLWGRPLYGPMIFLDPEARMIYANQPDTEKKLTEREGVYVGKVGKDFPAANTAYTFGGV